MQRKYYPTEKDATQVEEDDEPEEPKKGPRKKVMADFFKLRYTKICKVHFSFLFFLLLL
jgi:hypothetical protein